MASDAATMSATEQALAAIQRMAEAGDTEPELQFIRIPALYVDAFVLHYEDGKQQDMVVPVRDGVGLLTAFKPIPAREFYERLRGPAEERLRGSRDDAIAP
ncbi:hypothetical protein BH10PSE9_BH10PSE9_09110 [soil metagenome]